MKMNGVFTVEVREVKEERSRILRSCGEFEGAG